MHSPFPGMDPYLEMHWRDVHISLIVYASDQLNQTLPNDLVARIDGDESPLAVPDAKVVEKPVETKIDSTQTSGAVATEPTTISVPSPRKHRRIVILDTTTGNRVVTVIELLSPSNKLPGPDRLAYLRKQQAYLEGGVNLVEIDLVRSKRFSLTSEEDPLPESLDSTYRVCVRRASKPGLADLYRIDLKDTLPVVSLPLREQDADVLLDLQSLVHQLYKEGRYWKIDYTRELNPPLESEHREWAEKLLRTAGLLQNEGKGPSNG